MSAIDKDRFVKRALETASVEDPGNSFVPDVMGKVYELVSENSKLAVAEPIITKKGWLLAAFVVVAVFSLSFYFNSSMLNFSIVTDYIEKISFPDISIPVSGVFLTGLIALVFYFVIQIPLITKRSNV